MQSMDGERIVDLRFAIENLRMFLNRQSTIANRKIGYKLKYRDYG